MNRRELIDLCLTYPDAYEDYPFDPLPDENATAVIRHKKNRRSFALILRHNGMLYLNPAFPHIITRSCRVRGLL